MPSRTPVPGMTTGARLRRAAAPDAGPALKPSVDSKVVSGTLRTVASRLATGAGAPRCTTRGPHTKVWL